MEKMVALVTGGSRGIGQAIVALFESKGIEVLAPTREQMDLNDMTSIEAYCNQIEYSIDIIVNNAGINTIATLEDLDDVTLEAMLQINLKAPLKIVKCLRSRMGKKNIGRIVNLSSIWSFISKEGRCGYTAAKTAINGITRTLALELAEDNILVNAVAPGFVNTELTRQNNSLEEIMLLEKAIPLGRMAEPLEIANLVYFLSSEANTFITGQTILIDGGYTCK